MTDVTTVEGIVVQGQRKTTSGGYPMLPATVVVPAPLDTPEVQKGEPVEMDPCDHPDIRRRWDQDAAAVQAIQAFLDAAASLGGNDVGPNGPDLANREFGVPLIGVPRGGVRLGNVSYGEPQLLPDGTTNPKGSSVRHDDTGLTPYNLRGLVHSHPAGSFVPSPEGPDGSGDLGTFRQFREWVQAGGGNAELMSIYVVAIDPETGDYAVYAYDWENGGISQGRQVNPGALPCGV